MSPDGMVAAGYSVWGGGALTHLLNGGNKSKKSGKFDRDGDSARFHNQWLDKEYYHNVESGENF